MNMKLNTGKLATTAAIAAALLAISSVNAVAQVVGADFKKAEAYYRKASAAADAAEARSGVHSTIFPPIEAQLQSAVSMLEPTPPTYAGHREEALVGIYHAMSEIAICRKIDAQRKHK
jgi:hypothetical protein